MLNAYSILKESMKINKSKEIFLPLLSFEFVLKCIGFNMIFFFILYTNKISFFTLFVKKKILIEHNPKNLGKLYCNSNQQLLLKMK